MAIVTEISWDDMLDGKPLPENPARTAWRDAVSEIAEKAKATLPECNGRVDVAVKIVLTGDVELQADGTARVASQSNSTTAYHIINGECSCKDYPRTPHNFYKHRLSAAIVRRAHELATARLVQLDHATNGNGHLPVDQPPMPPTPDVPAPAPALPLPEAPASCNVYVTLAGRKVQGTLRDSDEQRLLVRLAALLQRFPAEDEPEQAPAEGWCSTHGVQMKLRNGEHGSWWSHKTSQGWCKGK